MEWFALPSAIASANRFRLQIDFLEEKTVEEGSCREDNSGALEEV
jgi:hypothetical protein